MKYILILMIVFYSCNSKEYEEPRNLFNKIDLRSAKEKSTFSNIKEKNFVDPSGTLQLYCEWKADGDQFEAYWLRRKDTLYFSTSGNLIPVLLFSMKKGDSINPSMTNHFSMDQYYIRMDSVHCYRNDTIYNVTHGMIPFMADDDEWDEDSGFVYKKDEARDNYIFYSISLRKGLLEYKKIKSKSKPRTLPYEN